MCVFFYQKKKIIGLLKKYLSLKRSLKLSRSQYKRLKKRHVYLDTMGVSTIKQMLDTSGISLRSRRSKQRKSDKTHFVTAKMEEYVENEMQTPNVQNKQPIDSLKDEYAHNDKVIRTLLNLKNEYHYRHWRPVRGDGNCYYRAVAFGLLEYILNQSDGWQNILTNLIAKSTYASTYIRRNYGGTPVFNSYLTTHRKLVHLHLTKQWDNGDVVDGPDNYTIETDISKNYTIFL